MGAEILTRAKPQFLLIDCIRGLDGLFHHAAFEGSRRVVSGGFDTILNAQHVEEMRKAPIMFISWCKSK